MATRSANTCGWLCSSACVALAGSLVGDLAAQVAPRATVTGRAEGVVVDALQQPVPAASVWIDIDGTTTARTVADGAGMFVLGRLPYGAATVRATADGCALAAQTVQISGELQWLRLQLFPARTITGRVTNLDGRPLAGAFVLADPDLPDTLDFADDCTTTDAEGRYEFRRVPIGGVFLRAWSPGHQTQEEYTTGKDPVAVDLALDPDPDLTVTLRLLGATPAELAAASFHVRAARGDVAQALPAPLASARPDADGSCQLVGMPRNVTLRYVTVSVPGAHCLPSRQELRSGRRGEVTLEFRLLRGDEATIRGTLVDGDGKPVKGVRLHCRAEGHGGGAYAIDSAVGSGISAADGSFALPSPVAPGEKFSLQSDDDKVAVWQPHDDVFQHHDNCFIAEHLPGAVHQVTTIVTTTVRGIVHDADGTPVAGAAIQLLARAANRSPAEETIAEAWTGRDGRFLLLRGLGGGMQLPVRVLVDGPLSASSTEFSLGEGDAFELEPLVAQPAAEVVGTVTDPRGRPLAGLRVHLFRMSRNELGTITDRNGRYRFVGVPPGMWQIRCTRGEKYPDTLAGAVAVDDHGVQRGDLQVDLDH